MDSSGHGAVGIIRKELLLEDFQVYNIDFNIFNGTLRFNLIDEEQKL